jgi:hypothetical protein
VIAMVHSPTVAETPDGTIRPKVAFLTYPST